MSSSTRWAALRASLDPRKNKTLIDDASTDPGVGEVLRELEQRGDRRIEFLRNERNLGFTATANRGMAHSCADVVLLNSDTIVTRGWLVDVAPLAAGDVIPLDAVTGIDPEPGDAVLFHTGWGAHWDAADTYLSGEPGPAFAVAEWLVERGVALTGCDTWSYGPVPAENPTRPFEVPQHLNVEHGVFIVENLDTSALARDGVREFALVLTFPKLRGATGAWTSPIALV